MSSPSNEPLREILDTYLRVPETPGTASQADMDLAAAALGRGVHARNLAHAIRVATLRRHLRDPAAAPLSPVRSLAYYLRTLEGLDGDALDDGYVDYVEQRFEQLIRNAGP